MSQVVNIQGKNVKFIPIQVSGETSDYFVSADRTFFLKKIKRFLDANLAEREAFLLNKLQKYRHFPIVIQSTSKYIIVEFIDGEPLSKTNAPEDLDLQVWEILSSMHREEIRHFDISPSELLVSDGELFLVDFGWGLFQNSGHCGIGLSDEGKPYPAGITDEQAIEQIISNFSC